jgi:hypothetical protein
MNRTSRTDRPALPIPHSSMSEFTKAKYSRLPDEELLEACKDEVQMTPAFPWMNAEILLDEVR